MKTKIVYVVVSDTSDYYLEQTLLSMHSMRLYNPSTEILLVMDNKTDETVKGERKAIMKYISKKVVVELPDSYSKMQKSRVLKTTLRQHVSGDYLFVDSDTIITDDLSEIDNTPFDIAAVPDLHIKMNQITWVNKNIKKWSKLMNWKFSNKYYYNSGVFYVKDTPNAHEFYRSWFEIWKQSSAKGLNIDQPSLAKADGIHNYVIKKLDDIWNCQINLNGLPYLMNAKIIHYFGGGGISGKKTYPYVFFNKETYQRIRNNGYKINNELHSKIVKAKSAFSTPCYIIGGTDVPLFSSFTYNLFLFYTPLFYIIEAQSRILWSICKLLSKFKNLIKIYL